MHQTIFPQRLNCFVDFTSAMWSWCTCWPIHKKKQGSGYPCSACMLGGTGNSHFYCSWPDMLHLLGNPPFLFLPPSLSPTQTHLTPHTLPYSGRCFWAPAPLDFILSDSSYKSQATSKLQSKRCDLTCKKYFLESSSVGQFQLTRSFLTGSQFQVWIFCRCSFSPGEQKQSQEASSERCTTS